MMPSLGGTASRFFLLLLSLHFSLLFSLQPSSKLIASSMDCSEKPLCMIKEKYIVMYIPAAINGLLRHPFNYLEKLINCPNMRTNCENPCVPVRKS